MCLLDKRYQEYVEATRKYREAARRHGLSDTFLSRERHDLSDPYSSTDDDDGGSDGYEDDSKQPAVEGAPPENIGSR